MLDNIKLCMECRWRRSIRDEGDKTPCALAPDTTLRRAREQCGGLQWSPGMKAWHSGHATITV